jgi:hypothetical protein
MTRTRDTPLTISWKAIKLDATAGQGRVDASGVALELVRSWVAEESRVDQNQPSCQVKNEYIVHSIALVG